MIMERITGKEYGGERPLYCTHGLCLEDVTIHEGESALKETYDIEALRCRFEGKYPFWCCENFRISECVFTEGARAALWYSKNLDMRDTLVEAPKMFRQMCGIKLRNVSMPNAGETLWGCRDIDIDRLEVEKGDYIFFHSEDIRISRLTLQGNYSFQYSRNVEIRDSVLNTKDAFWEAENVSVYDSVISGEFLGWHSRGLRLVRCRISGSQPLCYAENLILEDCSFEADADLAFEYSSIHADIIGDVTSVKNPRSGRIEADGYGEIIMDENVKKPADCEIIVRGH